ncbi:MAG TPA: nodulation protein NfeD, partial [Anaerolineales bacterium]|nr:nodulation protein NfeD [Anaerolineales bacterium]
MKIRRILLLLFIAFAAIQPVFAQTRDPMAVVLTADGPIMPPMLEYIKRGIETADQLNAEVVVIQLNTPGGSVTTMLEIIKEIRASDVPVVVYVAPKNAFAASAGAMITISGHVAAMAPETSIGASSPISSSGENLNSTAETKAKELIKASIRPFVTPRGEKAVELADAMVDEAKAVTANEALDANLIDFVSDDLEDLLQSLNGFTVQMEDGPRKLNTEDVDIQMLNISFIEQLLLMLTDPNISFLLLAIGVQAVLIELSSPGGWAAGFLGAVCLTLAAYGLGVLTVNWFGGVFLIIAFVLFVLDIKAPTHGALTTAGVASFIIGALVLFNSPGTPEFQRVSVPLVIGTGLVIGLIFFTIMLIALRSQHRPVQTGEESFVGKIGTAKMFEGEAGQVQVESELWSAEKVAGSDEIRKGDKIEVVEVRGLRLI